MIILVTSHFSRMIILVLVCFYASLPELAARLSPIAQLTQVPPSTPIPLEGRGEDARVHDCQVRKRPIKTYSSPQTSNRCLIVALA